MLSAPALAPGPSGSAGPRGANGARPANGLANGAPGAVTAPSPVAQGAEAVPVGGAYAPAGTGQPYFAGSSAAGPPPKNVRKRPQGVADPAPRKRRAVKGGAAGVKVEAGATATPEELTCQYCNQTFQQKRQRAIHVRTHHERAFPCEKCLALFKTKSDANRHLRIVHERLRPYSCTECTATFAERGKLRRHKQTVHEKLRPFRCEFCGAQFGERGNLNQHQTSRHASSLANPAAHRAT